MRIQESESYKIRTYLPVSLFSGKNKTNYLWYYLYSAAQQEHTVWGNKRKSFVLKRLSLEVTHLIYVTQTVHAL